VNKGYVHRCRKGMIKGEEEDEGGWRKDVDDEKVLKMRADGAKMWMMKRPSRVGGGRMSVGSKLEGAKQAQEGRRSAL
jgi:hypothetical protein